MDIEYKDEKLKDLCNSEKALRARWNPQMARVIGKRLNALKAATTLEDIRNVPGRCHELHGNRAWELAMDLMHPLRLVFIPNNNPVPTKEDGGLDWTKVTSVKIIEICDYH
jgi:proteic killer suppression protein